jgi:glutaredoxin 3
LSGLNYKVKAAKTQGRTALLYWKVKGELKMSDSPAKVVIYGAEWCPPCHTAKAYLKSRKVDFQYVNVDEDQEQGRQIAIKTGWTAIPILQIGSEYILGFDRAKIDGALQANKII